MREFGRHVVDVDVEYDAVRDVGAGGGVFGDIELGGAARGFVAHFGDEGAEGADEGVHEGCEEGAVGAVGYVHCVCCC